MVKLSAMKKTEKTKLVVKHDRLDVQNTVKVTQDQKHSTHIYIYIYRGEELQFR